MLTFLRDNNINTCIHLAAIADLNEAEDEPKNAHSVNVEGTRIVLSCCDEVGVRLLFASTCCAYGNNGVIGSSSELSPVVPTEIYAETKVLGEELVLGSSRVHDLRHVAMRLATFYGPDMRPALATALFLQAAENNLPIHIHGSGLQTRCFTHVHDIAEAIRVILQTLTFSGIVNIADNNEVSVNELADIAMRITGNKVNIIKEKDRKGQIKRSLINNDRLRGLGNLGWTPTVSLEDGLRGCRINIIENDNLHMTSPVTADVDCDHEQSLQLMLTCKLESTTLPTSFNKGEGTMFVSDTLPDKTQLIAYVVGDVSSSSEVAVRIHSECFNGDVLGSLKCDCGPQIKKFLSTIGKEQPGILIYVKGHEGRGAGLLTKTRAYNDLDRNPDKHHNDALLDAGAAVTDARRYDAASAMLLRAIIASRPSRDDVKTGCAEEFNDTEGATLILHTNNKDKYIALQRAIAHNQAQYGHFHCKQREIPAGNTCCHFNQKYLKEKEKDNGQCGLCVSEPSPVQETPSSTGTTMNIPDSIDPLEGVATTVINDTIFNVDDDAGIDEFIKENGFAIIRGLVSESQVKRAQLSHEAISRDLYDKVCSRIGKGTELSFTEFTANISQFRDLFLRSDEHGEVFNELMSDDTPASLASMARRGMESLDPEGQWDGIKLLHDHTITKPAGKLVSKKIPLHQDRMFWPVDTPACSTWTPLTDVHLDSGCMEVITLATKPHVNRQSNLAVDFMSDEMRSGAKMMLEEDPNAVRWLLPMQAGDTLVFSTNVWHRSSPNNQPDVDRLAYIQTWVHPASKWRPDLVPWHPVNEHLRREGYKPGDVLAGKRHPTIGGHCSSDGTVSSIGDEGCKDSIYTMKESTVNNATKQLGSDISMFDAGDVISTQIRNILLLLELDEPIESTASLVDIIKNPILLEQLVTITQRVIFTPSSFGGTVCDQDDEVITALYLESGCSTIPALLSWALRRLMISTAAYECDRSRNVFNSAYKAWWDVAGAKWNHYFLNGKFRENYKLYKTDVSRFLEYIHVKPQEFKCDSNLDNKLELLRAIIRGCFEYIPFQNLTMLTHLIPDGKNSRSPPTLGEIIEEMVTGFGGLCSIRNPFLFLLLKALTFDIRFVAGTMCFDPKNILDNAHVVLIVRIDGVDYWLDISNGWPYLDVIPLESDGSIVIKHSVMQTKLIKKKINNIDMYVVEHLPRDASKWTKCYYFQSAAVSYEAAFSDAMQKHYNSDDTFGHFLEHVRFNMWTEKEGVMLRDRDLLLLSSGCEEPSTEELDMWDDCLANKFNNLIIRKTGFETKTELVELLHEAWLLSQKNAGNEKEKITVTGGFFDESANGYIGVVTVWRSRDNTVMGLSFNMVKEYVPDEFPVINKGFTGGSWYNEELYVCWPNRVAIVAPLLGWEIREHIDNPCFNDLHHAHACEEGVWVANTGYDSVDLLKLSGELISRCIIADDVNHCDDDVEIDIRSQASHSAKRGCDKEHVNHVSVIKEEPNSQPTHSVMATLLQSKRVVRVENNITVKTMTKLCETQPPHEGFLQLVPSISENILLWNSTVDGHVNASDPETGETIRSWNLSEIPNIHRGWTRGLCILKDGFLVGSTAIRCGDAEEWIEKHGNHWNFNVPDSRTAVSFVPFDISSGTNGVKGVEFLNKRNGKIFSLLHTPPSVSFNTM